jgi:molecular chaperone DnaJ
MNLNQAYQLLNLSTTASDEEVKKAFKKAAAKLHPDVNKAPDAEKKFKEINEAYQIIQEKDNVGKSHPFGNVGINLQDIFSHMGVNPFDRSNLRDTDIINLNTTISFAESILGVKKEIKYTRQVKCQPCNGNGEINLSNGCKKCNGKGKIIQQQNNMILVQDCDQCRGRTKKSSCKTCNAEGTIEAEANIQVAIPGGVIDGNILNLSAMGNYQGNFGAMEQYTDTHLYIEVIPEPNLSLQGLDVITTLDLTLAEALAGCKKQVATIKGDLEVSVPSRSRHKEEIIIPSLGVNGKGNERVILEVKYPDDLDPLLSLLIMNINAANKTSNVAANEIVNGDK